MRSRKNRSNTELPVAEGQVSNRREITKIGEGAYGIVYRGLIKGDTAVKRNLIDHSINFCGSIREASVLTDLRGHRCIVTLLQILHDSEVQERFPKMPSDLAERYKDDHLSFVFEACDRDLLKVMNSEPLSIAEIRYFMSDLLLGLEYMHNRGYCHRDIKTPNLLIFNPTSEIPRRHLKICDFGLTQHLSLAGRMTPRVVTPWYRAPEMCSDEDRYTFAIDMWAVGCVFYEILSLHALCEDAPISDDGILDIIYSRIPQDCCDAKDPGRSLMITKEEFSNRLGLDREDVTKAEAQDILNLLIALLQIDPHKRITSSAALDCAFFEPIKDEIRLAHNMGYNKVRDTRYNIKNCPERDIVMSTAFMIFNAHLKGIINWYTHRRLFLAISLMDRYLLWKNPNKTDSEDGTIVRFTVCLYMAAKYYISYSYVPSWDEFVSKDYRSKEFVDFARDFERIMLQDVVKYKVYEPTVLELACTESEISDMQISQLLVNLKSVGDFQGTIAELLTQIQK